MTVLEFVRLMIPEFKEIILSPLLVQDKIVGYEATAYLNNGDSISGGTHEQADIAKRICVAELLERSLFRKIIAENQRTEYLINEYPTTCGFACGFDNEMVKARSVAEALERWIWSKWIDAGFKLDYLEETPVLDSIAIHLLEPFKSSAFYFKEFSLNNFEFHIGVYVGFTPDGAFPGSRVCRLNETPWQHAIIEASRNYRNFLNSESSNLIFNDIVSKRNKYFGKNRLAAEVQINLAQKLNWPRPEIRLLKDYNTGLKDVFLWRCILDDWLGWHIGDEKRFVY